MAEGIKNIDYSAWSHNDLIQRVAELEKRLKEQNTAFLSAATTSALPIPSQIESAETVATPPKPSKPFDPSKYTTRLIALKFAYLGQGYNGFEHHTGNSTPLPTIEEEIWKALVKTKLISPVTNNEHGEFSMNRCKEHSIVPRKRRELDMDWEDCEYSKCGRTDRGVSAFGQVIGIRVRSARRMKAPPSSANGENPSEEYSQPNSPMPEPDDNFDPTANELPYIQLLNRVLPPTIRIYAWCPNPPANFSARFSCRERRYKYFFTNPSFAPMPGSSGLFPTQDGHSSREGWLDIDKMREACKRLEGLHDFRNFCKLDPSKQITNFQRRIFHADIEEIRLLSLPIYPSSPDFLPPTTMSGGEQPKLYAFVIHGSAFLWHQVRSIVAILFLVGQGLEATSLISELLDIEKNPRKPKYEMASDAPLVLWDCIFPTEEEAEDSITRERGYEDSLDWIYTGERGGIEDGNGRHKGKWGRGGIIDDLWEVWRKHKIQETLSAQLLDMVAQSGQGAQAEFRDEVSGAKKGRSASARVFDGGDVPRLKGKYIPVLQKEKMEAVEVINEKFARKKGWDPANPRNRNVDVDE